MSTLTEIQVPGPQLRPRLADQQRDYLVRVLKDYKSGARKDGIMAPQAADLTDQDIADLAAYFSAQSGLFVKKAGRTESVRARGTRGILLVLSPNEIEFHVDVVAGRVRVRANLLVGFFR
jgi:hypothetical protein